MLQNTIVMLASVLLPMLLLLGTLVFLHWLKKRDRKRSPLTEKLLHQPGEQLRKKIEGLADDYYERVGRLIVIGPLLLLVVALPKVDWSALRLNSGLLILVLLALAFIVWNIHGVVRIWKERREVQYGLLGELATAQQLDKLVARGCLVFHDLPGSKGNIDHVVVAPNAVFAVETKWRSKHGKGSRSAEVWFDGKALLFPNGYRDQAPVDQATACARDLSKYLHGKTGDPVKVIPVVALPGWYVKDRPGTQAAEAKVINPKQTTRLLDAPGTPIPPAQRNRIVYAITERYPELDG